MPEEFIWNCIVHNVSMCLDQDNGHAHCPSCGEVIEMKALCRTAINRCRC